MNRTGSLPVVHVVATGGTIANTTRGRINVARVIRSLPELRKIAKLEVEEIVRVNSNSLTMDHWLQMAKRINTVLRRREVRGVVVTHGSNSLEETAYFLNLTVKNEKPVIITGAQRKFGTLSSDGPKNLVDSVLVAVSRDARGKGVLAVVNEEIHAARDVTKMMSHRVNTYHSHDFGVLGLTIKGRVSFYRSPLRRHTIHSEFDVRGHKALQRSRSSIPIRAPQEISSKQRSKNLDLMGLWWPAFLREMSLHWINEVAEAASRRGIPTVMTNRGGRDQLSERPEWVSADTLNPQKARVLLMLALTRTQKQEEIQRILNEY